MSLSDVEFLHRVDEAGYAALPLTQVYEVRSTAILYFTKDFESINANKVNTAHTHYLLRVDILHRNLSIDRVVIGGVYQFNVKDQVYMLLKKSPYSFEKYLNIVYDQVRSMFAERANLKYSRSRKEWGRVALNEKEGDWRYYLKKMKTIDSNRLSLSDIAFLNQVDVLAFTSKQRPYDGQKTRSVSLYFTKDFESINANKVNRDHTHYLLRVGITKYDSPKDYMDILGVYQFDVKNQVYIFLQKSPYSFDKHLNVVYDQMQSKIEERAKLKNAQN